MFLRIGHRGARAYAPENTLVSFKKAIQLGANAIELDIRQTKDKKLIVFHDENTKRLTGKDALVKDLRLKEIKQLDINRTKIPTLEEALDFLKNKVRKILIELKEIGFEKKVLNLIKERKLDNKAIIISFHKNALKNFRKFNKNIETGFLYVKNPNPIKTARELKVQYLLPLYRFIHTADVEKAHENGLKIIVWTINTRREVKEYFKKGVDGIPSDKPDILKNL